MPGVRGFSLVEVLLATSLLATGVLGLAQLLTMAVAVTVASRHTTSATVLAAQKVEEIRAGGELAGSGDSVNGYRRRWTIQPLPDSSHGLLVIQVTVEPVAAVRGRGQIARVTAVVPRGTP